MKKYQAKVAVIGGGPSGATAARHLALGGTNVILIE
jgi:flavin-dependent dehydrogenase